LITGLLDWQLFGSAFTAGELSGCSTRVITLPVMREGGMWVRKGNDYMCCGYFAVVKFVVTGFGGKY